MHAVCVLGVGLDPLAAHEAWAPSGHDALLLPVRYVGSVGIVHDLRDSHGYGRNADTTSETCTAEPDSGVEILIS